MSKKQKKTPDLLNGDVELTLRKMTVPMILGMITLMTFNLVDTFFVSLLGTQPLAAISFTFPVTFTVISLAIGLGIGTSAVIAKTLGEKNECDAKFYAAVALSVSAILVILLSIFGFYLISPIFKLLGAGDELIPDIYSYMSIWYLGSVFLVTPIIGNAVLRANGDTKTPSFIMALGGVFNVILDPLLIFGLGPIPAMGIKGAAIASVIAWSISVTLILYLLVVKKDLLSFRSKAINTFVATKHILKIGIPAAGANMLTPIAMAILTAIVATHGDAAVAAFGVGSRIESIASLVILALSMTLPPFISQNFGAGRLDRVEQGFKSSLKFIMFWQLIVYVILIAVSHWIAVAFTQEQAVAELLVLFIWILPLGYGLQGVIILANSSFNALHKPMKALTLSIVRLFIFYVPFAYVGSLLAGIKGLYIGALLGNLFTAVIAYFWFCQVFKTSKQKRDTEQFSS